MLILLLPIFLFKESVKKLNPDSTEKMLALSPMELSMGAKDRGDKMISYFPLLPLTGFLAFDAISPLFFPIFSVSNPFVIQLALSTCPLSSSSTKLLIVK